MKKISRREYLQTSATLGGSILLSPWAMANPVTPAREKVKIGLIGAGGIAKTCFHHCHQELVVAMAEVDEVRGAPGFEAFPRAARYRDFRKMLDVHAKELDLVIVNTPDHTHFPATYAAMERGIAVHTQKPLTHNIWQARTLQEAARKFGVQTVMGNQGHTMEGMRLIKDWYDAGLLGTVREVHAWTGRATPNNYNAEHPLPAEPVPATLDWDLWTGPAASKEYNSKICPSGWRWWWDYGLGGLGDIGCHTLDIPKYVLGLDYPSSVHVDPSINSREEFDARKPKRGAGTYVFEFAGRGDAPPVTVYWYEGGNMPRFSQALRDNHTIKVEGGCLLVGSENTLYSPGMRPASPRLVHDWDQIRRALPPKTTPRAVGDPIAEILAAIRGEIPGCGSNFDYAVPLTETVILGTIAMRSGKKVEYRPEDMTFRDPSLNVYIKEPVRPGWDYGEGLV